MYANTGNKHQKMAHERMLNGQGRKIVRQRVGGQDGASESNDLFRGIRPEQASAFDQEWESMADQMGFNYGHNRLDYGENNSHQQHDYSRAQSDYNGRQKNAHHATFGIDDGRRGHYIPSNARAVGAPVQNRIAQAQQGRGRREIEPTNPGGSIHAPGGGRRVGGDNARQNVAPMAL